MNPKLEIGSKIRRTFTSENDEECSEVGVVVHLWIDPKTQLQDAYVAFFGEEFPEGVPTEKPVILRYFTDDLELLG